MESFKRFSLIVFICLYGRSIHCLINGVNITSGQFAAHVVLFLPNNKVCGGEILSPSHVLTASSCVFNEENELLAPDFILISGKWNISSWPVVPNILNANVAAIYAHPKFDPYSKENDIAVVRLSEQLSLESNILLPTVAKTQMVSRIVADETSCAVGGYIENDAPSGLMQISFPLYNRIECNQKSESALQIKESMICAGAVSATASDIGSGLYCNGKLAGILSFGASCVENSVAVFTQVRMYKQWISDQLLRSDVPTAGPTPPPTTDKSVYFQPEKIIFVLIQFIYLFFQ